MHTPFFSCFMEPPHALDDVRVPHVQTTNLSMATCSHDHGPRAIPTTIAYGTQSPLNRTYAQTRTTTAPFIKTNRHASQKRNTSSTTTHQPKPAGSPKMQTRNRIVVEQPTVTCAKITTKAHKRKTDLRPQYPQACESDLRPTNQPTTRQRPTRYSHAITHFFCTRDIDQRILTITHPQHGGLGQISQHRTAHNPTTPSCAQHSVFSDAEHLCV